MTSATPALRIEGVSVSIGQARLLTDVYLSAHRGEILALVGPNGAGKSTLLAAAAGDLEPESGRVFVDEVDLTQWRTRHLARARSMMTQHHHQEFSFSVLEHVRLGRAPHPVGDDDEGIVSAALAAADLSSFESRDILTLSGGELARTVFARILAQQAHLVLLDEPTAALDLHHQEHVMARTRMLADSGTCVVAVLHDLSLAARFCDRIALLSEGHLAALGTPEQVLTSERIHAIYRQEVAVVAHPRSGKPVIVPL